jgi:hypothetical protein
LQNCSKRSAGLSVGGGVSLSGVSVGVVGSAGVEVVGGGVVSVVGVVSVSEGVGGVVSVSGIVSSGALGGGSADDSSSPPHPATLTARQRSRSAPRRAISARRPAAGGRSGGSR